MTVAMIPPAGFWAAAAAHASPGDQATLGEAAHDRGLYRTAAQLHKNAAASGNFHAAYYLIHPPACLHDDVRPASWVAAHVPLDDPNGVAYLLDVLQNTGAQEQAAALAARAAAHVPLDEPYGVADLLDRLREAWHAGAGGRAGRPCRRPRPPRRPGRRGVPPGRAEGRGRPGAGDRAGRPCGRSTCHATTTRRWPRWCRRPAACGRAGESTQFPVLRGAAAPCGSVSFRPGSCGSPSAPWGWEDLDLWHPLVRGDGAEGPGAALSTVSGRRPSSGQSAPRLAGGRDMRECLPGHTVGKQCRENYVA